MTWLCRFRVCYQSRDKALQPRRFQPNPKRRSDTARSINIIPIFTFRPQGVGCELQSLILLARRYTPVRALRIARTTQGKPKSKPERQSRAAAERFFAASPHATNGFTPWCMASL